MKKVDSSVKKGMFHGGEGGQAKKTYLGEVEGSMSGGVDAKALQDDLQSLGFATSLAKPEMGKEAGEERPTHKMTRQMSQGDWYGR